ncbi:MAG: hypothetical protein AB7U75_22565 [Hyphomicrobiaceae bacterium]|nr:hypothetical protein [Nitrospirales bacterium]
MDRVVGDATGARAAAVGVEDFVLRAALLAGYGREARALAAQVGELVATAPGRSCVEAGAPLQITIDAPGEAELRIGVRVAADVTPTALGALLPAGAAERLVESARALLPGAHADFGRWIFLTRRQQSMLVDLRDPRPADALVRIRGALGPAQMEALEAQRGLLPEARPWAVEWESGGAARVYWLLSRSGSAQSSVERMQPGAWAQVVAALAPLLQCPGKSGRWLIRAPLDGDPKKIGVGNSGWTLVPEDERKHRGVGELLRVLDGPRDYGEAMWSLCRGLAPPGWRVGRALEVEPGESGTRVRLFLTPPV